MLWVRHYLQRRDPEFGAGMAEALCSIATTAPDLSPQPGVHPTIARDHEYKRHGTVTLLAGIDLLGGTVHAPVKDRRRAREFIEFFRLLDDADPLHTSIKVILDSRSAHVSKETRCRLAA